MKPVRWLVLVVGLSAAVLLPALPELAAQRPCSHAINVQHYQMQVQTQQYFQQQQYQQQQQQLYRQQYQQQLSNPPRSAKSVRRGPPNG